MSFLDKFLKKEKPTVEKPIKEKIEPVKKDIFYPYKIGGLTFGQCHNLDGITYKTLKIIPRSKRTKENCNSCGVQND